MGNPLEDLVDADTLAALRAAAEGVDPPAEEKASSFIERQRQAARARAEGGGDSSSSSRSERDYTRDPIGQFASGGRRDSQGPKDKDKPEKKPRGKSVHTVKAGDTLYDLAERLLGDGERWKEIRDASGLGKDFDPKKLQVGTKLVIPGDKPAAGDGADKPGVKPGSNPATEDGGRDRDGDGDSDPARRDDGLTRVGSLEDVARQVDGWEDNIKPADRARQRAHLLARARALGASDRRLEQIRALPVRDTDKKDDDVSMQTKGPDAPAGLEHKAATATEGVQVLSADDETGIVEALVSVTGIVDNVKDQIEPGAYTKTMATREPIGVWSHDDKTWVARTEDAVELRPGDPFFKGMTTMDGKPWDPRAGAVKVKARFNLDTPHGKAAYSDVKFFQGKTGWSIGYRATQAKRNPQTGVRHIKELDWYEYSPVMVGAASQPMTLSVKSLSGAYTVDADDATGLVDEAVLEALTDDELARLDELKASIGLEVKARVRTAAGAARYDQPIGSVIVPDGVSGGNVGARSLAEGMTVDYDDVGADGPGGPRKVVQGKIEKVSRSGNITTITVGGKDHKLTGDSPVKVTDGAPKDAPLRDADLVTMMKAAEDDEERALIRQAAALPPGERREFLTTGGKGKADDAAGDKPAAKVKKGDQVRFGSEKGPEAEVVDVDGDKVTIVDHRSGKRSTVPADRVFADPDGVYGAPNVEVDGKPRRRGDKVPGGSGETYGDVADRRARGDDSPTPKDPTAPKVDSEFVDEVNSVIDSLKRSAGGKHTEETDELQSVLDDYEKDPSEENAKWVGEVLEGLKGEVDVGAVDDALARIQPAASKPASKPAAEKPAPKKAAAGPPKMRPRTSTAESRNPEAARERDQRAERARTRQREQDSEADQRVKDRQKLAALNKRRRAKGQPPLLRLPDTMKSLDFAELTDDELEVKVWDAVEAGDDVEFGDPDLEEKGSRASLDRKPGKNWIEAVGGELPPYVREVARAVEREQGLPLDRAIPIAISRIKRWAAGGDGVKPDTVAKAQAAVAEWEALKARAGKKYDSELLEHLEEKGWAIVEAMEVVEAAGFQVKAADDEDDTWGEFDADDDESVEEKTYAAGSDELYEVLDLIARGAEVKSGLAVEPAAQEDFGSLLARRAALDV